MEQGSSDVITRAAREVKEILAGHYPAHIPQAIDASIRARFPVKLDLWCMLAAGAS